MNGANPWVLAALACLLAFPLRAEDAQLAASLKLYHLQTDQQGASSFHNSFKARTSLRQPWGEGLSLSLTYELLALETPAESAAPRPYRLDDLHPNLWEDETTRLAQNLDRAALNLSTPGLDLTLGRQPLAFGNGRLVNPTDVFTGFNLTSLDQEDRLGLDALRLQIPLGELSNLDFGVLAATPGEHAPQSGFAKAKLRLWEQDVTLIAAQYGPHRMQGFDTTFSLAQAGVWLEAARTHPGADNSDPTPYWRWVAGLDYAFPQDVYLSLEWHHNGAGQALPEHYPQVQANQAYTRANGYLWGREYLSLSGGFQPHPLVSLRGQWLQNQNDGSAFASLGGDYSLSEDSFAEGGFLVGSSNPSTEFGAMPQLVYLALRFYL